MDVEEKEAEEGGRLLEQTDKQIHTVPTNLTPAAKSIPAVSSLAYSSTRPHKVFYSFIKLTEFIFCFVLFFAEYITVLNEIRQNSFQFSEGTWSC